MKHHLPLLTVSLALFLSSAVADADESATGESRASLVTQPNQIQRQDGDISDSEDRWSCWHFRASPGVAIWFFEEENTLAGPALHFDAWNDEYPLNFRVGAEGRHMYLSQDNAQAFEEFSTKEPKITYIRIPFALEYRHEIAENTEWFVGGGPDILRTANDNSDTSVGFHLGTRIGYNFTEQLGVALEAGYMWGDVDSSGGEIELDTAYLTPLLTMTF